MTRSEVKKELVDILAGMDCQDFAEKSYAVNISRECVAVSINALEKQIPKPVIGVQGRDSKNLLCPACESFNGYIENKFVFGSQYKYCWHCGQALTYDYLFEQGYEK